MRKFLLILGLGALLIGSISTIYAFTDPVDEQRVASLETRVTCLENDTTCPPATATVEPTATATAPAATATEHHPTPTAGVSLGWHSPGSHNGLNNHEHGDAPPAWVLASAWQPFTQTRESHTGYKGVYDSSPGGAESYLIGHILSTEAARSHGDHDYQFWLRDPQSGQVFYWEGVMCFAQPCTSPTPERTSDTGERPIVLGERNASDG